MIDEAFAAVTGSPVGKVPPVHVKPYFEDAGEAGKRTLWVVFVVMLVASVVFTGMAWNVATSKRLYHVITTFITVIAALSYFAMASGAGIGYHHAVVVDKLDVVGKVKHDVFRQVYWARYVDWSLTTPLLLLDLGLLAGLSGGSIVIAIFADIVMVLTGLFAAFGSEGTAQKWGWYAIACIAYLTVVWQLVFNGRRSALAKGGKVSSFFAAIGGFTLIIWTVYPIIWGVADGSRHMSVDQEIIAYAVLDILAKPVFGAWLLFTHVSIPETNVEIGGFWSHGLAREGVIRVGDDDEGAGLIGR